jgi:uncharacterized protein
MKNHIIEIIKQIEMDYDIKILYACESGSRAWGFPSKDSDYDVRFIYVHKVNWYLSIDQLRDVIVIPKHDPISIPIHNLLDVSGWELSKALKLFRKSNPPLLEWICSSIVYYKAYSTIDRLRNLGLDIFAPNTGLFHYLSMAKRNFRDYEQSKEVQMKTYFHILRPLLAAKWIENNNTFPPIQFQKLMEEVIEEGELKNNIHHLLSLKTTGDESNYETNIDKINVFLNEELLRLDVYAKSINIQMPDSTEKLNELFRETLREVWD